MDGEAGGDDGGGGAEEAASGVGEGGEEALAQGVVPEGLRHLYNIYIYIYYAIQFLSYQCDIVVLHF